MVKATVHRNFAPGTDSVTDALCPRLILVSHVIWWTMWGQPDVLRGSSGHSTGVGLMVSKRCPEQSLVS